MSVYDYNKTAPDVKAYLPVGYKGDVYRITREWLDIIPAPKTPIKYLEIGAYHGASICSVMKTHTTHASSIVHCIDPWFDYDEFDEYKNTQPTNYSLFLQNVSKLDIKDLNKLYIHRGLSNTIVPTFPDESFDIIFIDGNHATQYVFEDALLASKKVKRGGWIVFDDFDQKDVKAGIDYFMHMYSNLFEKNIMHNGQLFSHRKE